MRKQLYVAGFAFDRDRNRVALIRKKRPKWQEGLLNAIGGKVEPDENPIDAMRREFFEETGAEVPHWTWMLSLVDAGHDAWEVYFYFANDVTLENLRSMEDEKVEIHWVSDIDHLPVIKNLRWLVPMAVQGEIRTGRLHDFSAIDGTGAQLENGGR